MNQSSDLIQSAPRTMRPEIEAKQSLPERPDGDFVRACQMLLASTG
ncbi:D-arabinose 5-phosphate isomerase, partial [Pseudomonas syringae]